MNLIPERIGDMMAFMEERHHIYHSRQKDVPPPWTNDPILSTQFFTNVYREFDRATIFFRKFVREPFAKNPNLPQMVALCRWFGDIGFIGEIARSPNTFPIDRPMDDQMIDNICAVARRFKAAGFKVWTSAYMVCTGGLKMTKEYYSAYRAREAGVLSQRTYHSLESAWNELYAIKGWQGNGFMAYEVVSDLRWTPVLDHAHDVFTWANAGPGAQRGLNRVCHPEGLHESDLNRRIRPDEAAPLMRDLLESISPEWVEQFPDDPPLEMREIEHSLCEFDKYERVRMGTGHSKRRFDPYK